jgi:hypothetical protein
MKRLLLLSTVLCVAALPALADDAAPSLMPSMTGPLAANAKPFSIPTDYGRIYVGGVVTGLGQWQSNPAANDKRALADLDNGAIIINKADGVLQFFAHVGVYSIPDVGVPYVRAGSLNSKTFGPLAEGYVKVAPTDDFSVEAGKLPTLIGNEYTYSFQNMNIERGLLWNQENDVNRGAQANYTAGPVALSLSWSDGYYSNRYTWLWGSATWTIDSADSMTFVAGGNTRHVDKSSFITPVFQNNSRIFNAYYTRTDGPWTFQLNGQVTHVPEIDSIGALSGAGTCGAGIYASYKFNSEISLPARAEYIASTGSAAKGAPNLLYGQGSKAWSFTVTPTWQRGVFFIRPEASFVDAVDATAGSAFGYNGNDHMQARALIETGFLF